MSTCNCSLGVYKQIAQDFMSSVSAVLGKNLISAYIYGSVVTGEFSTHSSDINVLIITSDTVKSEAKLFRKILRSLKFKKINPLFMSKEFLLRSLDVFPIEFLEIKKNNVLLLGEDIVAACVINAENVRLECEHDLKAKEISLFNAIIHASSEKEKLYLILKIAKSVSLLLPYIVEFFPKSSQQTPELKTINQVLTSNEKTLKKIGLDSLMQHCYQELSSLNRWIDTLDKTV